MPSLNLKMYKLLENTLLDEKILGKLFQEFHLEKIEKFLEIKVLFLKK